VPVLETAVELASAKLAVLRSEAVVAIELIELMVYVAGCVAPLTAAVTAVGSELVALSDWPLARAPRALRLLAKVPTDVFRVPSNVSCERTFASWFWSAVIGI